MSSKRDDSRSNLAQRGSGSGNGRGRTRNGGDGLGVPREALPEVVAHATATGHAGPTEGLDRVTGVGALVSLWQGVQVRAEGAGAEVHAHRTTLAFRPEPLAGASVTRDLAATSEQVARARLSGLLKHDDIRRGSTRWGNALPPIFLKILDGSKDIIKLRANGRVTGEVGNRIGGDGDFQIGVGPSCQT